MFVTVVLFIVGFVFLIKGADLVVDASSSIAKRYGISNMVIGLTIVAFGTSFPELMVSALASLRGDEGVAFGNIVGSNISNTLLILGVSAIIRPLVVKRSTVNKEIPLSLLAVAAVFFLVNDSLIDNAVANFLSRADGLVLILFFIIFIYYTFGISRVDHGLLESIQEEKIKTYSPPISGIMILLGLSGLFLGGEWIVSGAVEFAKILGLSETMVGLTIVAIGTSLPELAASGMAAYRGKTDIAIGAVVGSNIFNLFWVLGLSSIIRPIVYDSVLNFDFSILFAVTLLLLYLIFSGKKNTLDRREGIILIIIYISYIIALVVRG